jgi:hypothetical protein
MTIESQLNPFVRIGIFGRRSEIDLVATISTKILIAGAFYILLKLNPIYNVWVMVYQDVFRGHWKHWTKLLITPTSIRKR